MNSLIDKSSSSSPSSMSRRRQSRIFIVFALLALTAVISTVAQTVESGQFTTTVKKELSAQSSSTESTPVSDSESDIGGRSEDDLLKPIAEPPAAEADGSGASVVESGLLPEQGALFSKDAIDVRALDKMDCHLRNMDYCYAGILGASQKALPETDAELEIRCDEMRAMTTCMALYNKRCGTMKVFAMLAPMANMESMGAAMPDELRQMPIPAELISAGTAGNQQQELPKLGDLSSICSPQAKTRQTNRQIRQRLFQLARCINQRIPHLTPCIEDLKTAVQLLYEPRRSLPLKPTCCALSRFRNCSMGALDDICGLESFAQLESSLNSGPTSMLKTVERICRQESSKFDSPYCREILPPSGMRAPQRRGNKASKLAKALDLISFAPATQPF